MNKSLRGQEGGEVSGCPRGQKFEKMANDYEKSRLGQNWST